jgi:predicted nicotinamide N-methyase
MCMYALGAGCGLTSIVLGEMCSCNVLAVDKASVMKLLDHNIHTNCVSSLAAESITDTCSHAHTRVVKSRCFDWNDALECTQKNIRNSLQWSDESTSSASAMDDTESYHFPHMIVLSDCFYQFDAVDPILKLLNAMAGESTFILVANELRTAFDEFLNKMKKQNIPWQFEVSALKIVFLNAHHCELNYYFSS